LSVIAFVALSFFKLFGRVMFRVDVAWVSEPPEGHWHQTKVGILLNHTSLFEFLYVTVLPFSFIWKIARTGVFPIADVTAEKKVMGTLLKILARNVVPLTRKRDDSWEEFMNHVSDDRLVLMMPEGRMKRLNGLDKYGNPMTVRGGVADVLEKTNGGRMLVVYSAGLHHVFPPGAVFPRFFKKISAKMESIDIDEYKASLAREAGHNKFRKLIVEDLERRRDRFCDGIDN